MQMIECTSDVMNELAAVRTIYLSLGFDYGSNPATYARFLHTYLKQSCICCHSKFSSQQLNCFILGVRE